MHTNPPSDVGNAATFIAEIYGQDVFNMETMRNYLPRPVYKKLLATIRKDEKLDPDIANEVAQANLRNARLNFRQQEPTHIMENIVYNELCIRGYHVDVGIVEALGRDSSGKRLRKQKTVLDRHRFVLGGMP